MVYLSIIVPVYNVEEYLGECLASLSKSPLQNIEYLLIDDGSTDGSYEICKCVSEKDKRFKVFRKKNGGLSSARNYGIDRAEGNYLGFVDSDDIIVPEMFQSMIETAAQTDADIVACGIIQFWGDINNSDVCVHVAQERIVEGNEILSLFVDPKGLGDYAVNKIYRKSLFDGIRYPEGHIFEDIYTTYKLFEKANKVYCLNKDYYYYRQRTGSVSHAKAYNPKLHDIVLAVQEQYELIERKAPDYITLVSQKYLDANIIEMEHISKNKRLIRDRRRAIELRNNIRMLSCKGISYTRYDKARQIIAKGLIYWFISLRLTKWYTALGKHPRVQDMYYNVFKRLVID